MSVINGHDGDGGGEEESISIFHTRVTGEMRLVSATAFTR